MCKMFRVFLLSVHMVTGFILNSASSAFSTVSRKQLLETSWQSLDPQYVSRVMVQHFGEDVCKKNCKLFCIAGIPAASIVFEDTNEYNDPIVESIYINKELVLLFDVGPTMRATLYDILKRINLTNATGRDAFLIF